VTPFWCAVAVGAVALLGWVAWDVGRVLSICYPALKK
jgi:hypothetical protein